MLKKLSSCVVLGFLLVLSCAVGAQTNPVQPLAIATESLPGGVVGEPYQAQLVARGGTPPHRWRLDPQSKMPTGLRLEPEGTIVGTPTEAGEFRFLVEVSDSGREARAFKREFTILISTAFSIEWRKPPTVERDQINGSVLVSNGTNEAVDLTVIIVAVNAVNKAFALGYQHFTLNPKSKSPVIPFGSSMPFGRYVVHADAIGEVPSSGHIYRSRLQTSAPLVITQQ